MLFVVNKHIKVNISKFIVVAYCGLDAHLHRLLNIAYWRIKLNAHARVAKPFGIEAGIRFDLALFTPDKTACYLCIAYVALVEAQLI